MNINELFNLIYSDIEVRAKLDGKTKVTITDYGKIVFNHHLFPIVLYRFQFWFYSLGLSFFAYVLKMINQIFFNIDIGSKTVIGPGFLIAHANMVVISDQCVIGKKCIMAHHNTVHEGYERFGLGKEKVILKIGDNVLIGAGARILGPVEIGNNVAIGSNTMVDKNVSDNSVVIGVPAKIIKKEVAKDNG